MNFIRILFNVTLDGLLHVVRFRWIVENFRGSIKSIILCYFISQRFANALIKEKAGAKSTNRIKNQIQRNDKISANERVINIGSVAKVELNVR